MAKTIVIILTLSGFASGAEFDVNDRLSVDGSTLLRSTLTVDGSSIFKSTAVFSGNVGIGTTVPNASLDVRGSVALGDYNSNSNVLRLFFAGGVGDVDTYKIDSMISGYNYPPAEIAFGYATGGIGYLNFKTGGVPWGNNPTERMRIDQSGNVGIGTTSPSAKLDIGGTDSVKIPVGTTAQRPISPAVGMMRFNSTRGKM